MDQYSIRALSVDIFGQLRSVVGHYHLTTVPAVSGWTLSFSSVNPQLSPGPGATISLVESIPLGLTYGPNAPRHMSTYEAWNRLISLASYSIDIGSFYWTLQGSDVVPDPTAAQGEDILDQLIVAGTQRDIKIRIAQNLPREPSPDINKLETLGAAKVRTLDFNRLVGAGILHTKLWIVDRQHLYVGSANMDWRALTQCQHGLEGPYPVDKVLELVHEDRQITVREVAEEAWISFGSTQSIMKDILGVRRLNAVLVPKDLTFDQKNARKETASLNLEATTDDPELLKRVITGDETWIYGFDSETTQQPSEWRFKNEPTPKKARKAPSKVKVMLTVFFDYHGIVNHEFQQQGSTITADSYMGVLRRLREAIKQKRLELWRSKSWILHHDNAPAHTALKISKFLQDHSTCVPPTPLQSRFGLLRLLPFWKAQGSEISEHGRDQSGIEEGHEGDPENRLPEVFCRLEKKVAEAMLIMVKESGLLLENCRCLAEDVQKIFEMYWMLGLPNAKIPPVWPTDLHTEINVQKPLPVSLNGTNSTVYIASSPQALCPTGRTSDLDAILDTIARARKFVHIAVMDYFPTTLYGKKTKFWPVLDNALRKAAVENRIQVRLMGSHWNHTRPAMSHFLRSLSALNSSRVHLETAMIIMQFDFALTNARAPFGTSNWAADYFLNTGGVGFVVHGTDHPFRQQLADVFDRDWNSIYAT
ncbi:PLD4 [Cordylochernes scorpioides]|uniref:PLD4 n=1 Tax=Cordylochernes scorpioides TaxID=51811 RepID=A0ABY6KDY5_9ARAC|nr:PLD4 [Cordylochernes scorpioides]